MLLDLIAQQRAEHPIDVKWKPLNVSDLDVLDEIISARVLRAATGQTPEEVRAAWIHGDVQRVELLRAKIERLLKLTEPKSPTGF